MKCRIAVSIAVLAVAALGAVPSQAANKAPIKGSYTLSLLPDPTYQVLIEAGKKGCVGFNPQGKDTHHLSIPGAGKLHVTLDSADPTPGAAPIHADWDLYTLDSDGAILSSSTGGTPHEETLDKFKGKTSVSIAVCNNNGEQSGKVSYTFTYA